SVLELPTGRRPPRGSRGDRPIEERPDIEHAVHARGGRWETVVAVPVTRQHVGDSAVGNEEPQPMAPHQHALEAPDLAGPGKGALEAGRRGHSEPERAVD